MQTDASNIPDRSEADGLWIANAPCSYGAFEVTVGVNPNVPDPESLLGMVSSAGYSGIDLGPISYLGEGEVLLERMRDHGLGLAGGYLQLNFSRPDLLNEELAELDRLLAIFDLVGLAGRLPVPTLADAGSAERRRWPGMAANDTSFGLDGEDWHRFLDGLQRVASRCREHGYEPALHPHAGTFIEAAWEVERLLDDSDIAICFDPGHLVVGGIEPVAAQRRWAERIGHYHLKDVSTSVLKVLISSGSGVETIYASGAFCRLGEGEVDLDALIDHLRQSGYRGWLVVEQDLVPDSAAAFERAGADQLTNREFLARRGL